MRKFLPVLLVFLIIVLLLEGIYYFYLTKIKPTKFSAPVYPKEIPQKQTSLTISNFHPQLKLVSNLNKEEEKRLIEGYNKTQVEIKVAPKEEDLPPRPQGGGRGVGTYTEENGNLVLQYRLWSEYQPDKQVFWLYLNPEVFGKWQKEGRNPEKMISRWFLDFLANNDYHYLLPDGQRIEPKQEDIRRFVEEKPVFSLQVPL
jgi:hypothetical protein